jgi:hypothetical protein
MCRSWVAAGPAQRRRRPYGTVCGTPTRGADSRRRRSRRSMGVSYHDAPPGVGGGIAAGGPVQPRCRERIPASILEGGGLRPPRRPWNLKCETRTPGPGRELEAAHVPVGACIRVDGTKRLRRSRSGWERHRDACERVTRGHGSSRHCQVGPMRVPAPGLTRSDQASTVTDQDGLGIRMLAAAQRLGENVAASFFISEQESRDRNTACRLEEPVAN